MRTDSSTGKKDDHVVSDREADGLTFDNFCFFRVHATRYANLASTFGVIPLVDGGKALVQPVHSNDVGKALYTLCWVSSEHNPVSRPLPVC